MAEPTGRLTFGDLILEAAIEIGTAYYGSDGSSAAAAPTDAHDLAEAKRHVNNAIRHVLMDGPAGGWRWRRAVASLVLWPSVAVTAGVTCSGGAHDAGNNQTTITANTAKFYPSMERHDLVITGVGTFTIKSYTSSTVVVVTGDASAASSATFSVAADGNYTLAESFSGGHTGDITYAADTGQGAPITWSDEGTIRALREDDLTNDYPRLAAVRAHEDSRRWELLTWPVPSAVCTVEFPYQIHFTLMSAVTEIPITPYSLDALLLAAVKMVLERDVHRALGVHTQHYQQLREAAWAEDQRSAPRKIGSFNNGGPNITINNFRQYRDRPAVDTTNISS